MSTNNPTTLKNTFEPGNKQVLETWPIERIKTDPSHPRKTTKKQIEKAARALAAADSIPPIIVDSAGVILAGQVWLEAAKNLGVEEAQVLIVSTLTKAQSVVYRNAYDKILEQGEWDKKNLAADFNYLIEMAMSCEIDYSVEAMGFEIGEIDFIIGQTDAPPDNDENHGVSPEKPTVTQPDDIWEAGPHRIGCGDATNEEIYKKLIGASAIDLIFTDFPYNVAIDGFVSSKGKHKDFAMGCGEMSDAEFVNFIYIVMIYALLFLVEGGCIFLSIDWRHVDQMMAACKRCNLTLLNICVWDKGVGGMGSLYRSQHEFILVYRKGSAQHTNNVMLGKHGRNRTNVWQYPSANMSKEGRQALQNHPTPKPVAMITDIIRDVTKHGDIVLDTFLGSGTTLIAAEKTGRICYALDLEPKYVDVSIRRWQKLTGKKAINAKTRLTFDEHEQLISNEQQA